MNAGDSVATPLVVIAPILFALTSVKRRLFWLPGRMIAGVLGVGKSIVAAVYDRRRFRNRR
jgi:hypothetical protein